MNRLFFLILLLSPFMLNAQDINLESSSSFQFLNINFDGRSTALGGVHSTLSSQRYGLGLSPAALGNVDSVSFAISVKPIILDINSGAFGGAVKLPCGLVFSPEFLYLSLGSISSVDEYGDSLGISMNPYSYSLGLSLGYRFLDILNIGGKAKIAKELLVSDSSTFGNGSALALMYDFAFMLDYNRLRLSGGVRNFGLPVTVITGGAWLGDPIIYGYKGSTSMTLPSSVFSGLSLSLPGDINSTIFIEAEKYINSYLVFRGALEVSLFSKYLDLRVGSSFTIDDIKEVFNSSTSSSYDNSYYSKSDWSIVNMGFGFNVPLSFGKIFVDGAIELRVDGIEPGFTFSGGYFF